MLPSVTESSSGENDHYEIMLKCEYNNTDIIIIASTLKYVLCILSRIISWSNIVWHTWFLYTALHNFLLSL